VAAVLWITTVSGCASEPPLSPIVAAMVGNDAKLVAHGVPPLQWTVPSAGNLAVVDKTLGAVLTYCSIRNAGQLLSIDPQEASVILGSPTDPDRRDILASDIDVTHEYAVYFTATKPPPSQAGPAKRPGLK
jgi:hypothetical protein